MAVHHHTALTELVQFAEPVLQFGHRKQSRAIDLRHLVFVSFAAIEQQEIRTTLEQRFDGGTIDLNGERCIHGFGYISSSSAITSPLRILGSNQVDFGGMNSPCSHTATN